MSAPSRRKRKPRVITFTLVVEAQEMIVEYQPNLLDDTGMFEFRSPHEPPRRIPISETGYRSHFAQMDEVEAAASPQDYAREIVLAHLRSRQRRPCRDGDQLFMF
jgi:hypothetical protein